jgi:hypothetical protein
LIGGIATIYYIAAPYFYLYAISLLSQY